MNSVLLTGRLTNDPRLSYGGDPKTAYCDFAVAVQRGSDKNGDPLPADFPYVIAFGRLAENMEKYLEKGCRACVEGELRTDSFEKDGKTHYRTRVFARRIEFLEFKKQKPDEG